MLQWPGISPGHFVYQLEGDWEQAGAGSVTGAWRSTSIRLGRSHSHSSRNVVVRSRRPGSISRRPRKCWSAGAGFWRAGPSNGNYLKRKKQHGSPRLVARKRLALVCS